MTTPYIPFTQLHMLFGKPSRFCPVNKTHWVFIGNKDIVEITGLITCREYKLHRYRCRKTDNAFFNLYPDTFSNIKLD